MGAEQRVLPLLPEWDMDMSCPPAAHTKTRGHRGLGLKGVGSLCDMNARGCSARFRSTVVARQVSVAVSKTV